MSKRKKAVMVLILICLLAGAGGALFYWQKNQAEPDKSPRLFAKEDYKIEQRADGQYVLIEKIGFSAKAPENWQINIEGSDYPEPGYWVNMLSPEAEVRTILTKGCGISILAGVNKESAQEIKETITLLKNGSAIAAQTRENYQLYLIELDRHKALGWKESQTAYIGQSTGVDIPLKNNQIINLGARFPQDYDAVCQPIWNQFIGSIKIK